MIIGIDTSRANRDKKTGVEWYAWQVIQELKKIIPPEMEVVLYSREKLKGELAELPNNWQAKVLSWPPKFLWTHLRLSWEMLRNKPDLLFIPAHVIPLIHPPKTVITIHDLAFKKLPSAYSIKSYFYLDWAAKFANQHASKIITISQTSKKDLIELYQIAENKIEVIPLAYATAKYKIINDHDLLNNVLNKYNLNKPFVISIGRLETKKNTVGIIEAFTRASQELPVELQLLLGGNPGRGYKKVKAALAASPVESKIITPGWIDEADIPLLMNAAEIFLFPSFYEGFGIPILEAMACGCPVITSNITACPEVAGDDAVLVDPKNIDEISRQILKIIKDRDFREEMVERGLARVKKFSWQKTAEETWEVIRGVKGQ